MAEKDDLKDALEQFKLCEEAEQENHRLWLEDMRFARLAEQWPEDVKSQREAEGRPCLTINKLPAFIRQVTNDARQNTPAIKVHPVDDEATEEVAEILNGLIRNIEYSSNSDVAKDTALDHAVTASFGYMTVNTDYACDDQFDQDIRIEAVTNPLCIHGDPEHHMEADSANWNVAFVTEMMKESDFKRKYKNASLVPFDGGQGDSWFSDGKVRIASWWTREEVPKTLLKLSNGEVMYEDAYLKMQELFSVMGVEVTGTRETKGYKTTQRIITGSEILETLPWQGKYIPIIPVYGDMLNIEGKRHLISLIRGAKDAQQMFNYWRPLALDTPIPTPNGWATMGSLKVGDEVLTETGKPTKVIGESPVHLHRDCYRITFDDGSSIVADAQHPWPVEERAGRTAKGFVWNDRIANTEELTPGKHFIKTPDPLELPHADLRIDPYLLGVWLGDGTSACGGISQADGDIEELRGLIAATGYKVGDARHYKDRVGVFTVVGLTSQLQDIGVRGNKHVPANYLRASKAQREALMQGLMDTDGSIDAKGQCSFTSANPVLAQNFAELARSLGIKAVMCKRVGRVRMWADGRVSEHADSYQFSFTPSRSDTVFRLSRKLDIQKKERKEHIRRAKRYAIRSVVRVESVPVKCIAIGTESHLFLAGEGMIPTHNTASTELVALAPKAPYVGPVGSFNTDLGKWETANIKSHPFIEYDNKGQPPQRQPFAGVPAGALQEAMNASDDMKTIMGLYDASLGARSNETSGKAILARQREGDVSTFNFIDNLSRSIRHLGRVIVDLIPHVYDAPRIIRILHEDGSNESVKINQEHQAQAPGQDGQQNPNGQMPPAMGAEQQQEQQEFAQGVMKMYDVTVGKYDVTCESGPSYTTKREEAAEQMMQFVQAIPQAGAVTADLIAKNLDWPGADDFADRLAPQGANPQVQQLQQAMQQQGQQAQQAVGQLKQELDQTNQKLQQAELDKQYQERMGQLNAQEAQIKSAADNLKAREQLMSLQEQLLKERMQNASLQEQAKITAVKQPEEADHG